VSNVSFNTEEIPGAQMNPSVLVGIPSGEDWKADFGMSMVGMMVSAQKPLKNGSYLEKIQVWNTKGSILSRSRHTLAKQARELGMTHLLMIDSDMTFPVWTLHQMLSHDVDVVAANCATKGNPSYPTARKQGDKPAGKLVQSKNKKGLEKVWRVGTGVMLIKTSVFDRIAQPWFGIEWNAANDDYTGEDWTFCQACQAAGIDIHIDHMLSGFIGHLGVVSFTMENTLGEGK
jgi:hypothetical protein